MKKSVREKLKSLIHKYESEIELLEFDEDEAIERRDFIAASKIQSKRFQLKQVVIDLKNLLK